MTDFYAAPTGVSLGDPVPWFSARSLNGGDLHLHVNAGRWVVLSFFHELSSPRAQEEFRALVAQVAQVSEDRLVAYAIFTAPPENLAVLLPAPMPTLRLVADYDGAVTRLYGAKDMRRTVVLDPMLRAIAIVPWDNPNGHAAVVEQILGGLPEVDLAAGAPITAPALIVPRVFDFDLCDFLVRLYDKMGGEDSGFLLDNNGKTGTVVDHRLKRRRDLPIVVPELRERMRVPIVKRLLPAIERYFQFSATRMDRYLVSCYDSNEGGYFRRHRDNLNAGAEHRRFAVSLNLNRDYDGCDLVFPEFGRRTYRAPVGGAIVFSCGALHEVTPITRGRRYAFVPFLYGEEDAAKRLENNSKIAAGSARYTVGDDFLYPPEAPASAAE
ncbi:MAG TPA: redoxin domain-containing protein [Stellaceae bacterium]|nr:redoxin domain-containing protein [Stellaceae bacterium]